MTVVEITPVLQDVDTDEGDGFAHIVDKKKLTDAMIFGTPITALCGYTWVPSRDPKNFPTCQVCLEMRALSNSLT